MIRFVFHLCLLAVARAATTSSVEGCDINVRLDITGKNPPVVLIQDDSGQYILAEPNKKSSTASYLSVGNKKILLACPGKRNKLSVGGRSEVEATCTSEGGVNYFVVNGKRIKTDSVSCTSRVQPYELITDRVCNDDGKILKLGYMVQGAIKSLINTCHRVADGTTYYSTHVVDGSALPQYLGEKRADDSGRPFFSTHNAALFRGFPAKKYYDQANQLVALSSAIGATAAQATFDARHNKYFAKGHLAPNADFMFSTSRDITFAFVNVQPQWQMINGGHWSHLESAVRKSAASSGRKYFIATGTSGVLSPQGTNVFLDVADQKIPVPETYTKVVRDVKTNQCMAFISNNFSKDSAPEELCENVCSTYKWPKYSSSKEGYIYCCLYDDFKAQFPRNAPTMDCSGGGLSY